MKYTKIMPKFLVPIAFTFLIIGCKQEGSEVSGEDGATKDLKNQIAQLEHENAMKDSVINESLAFYNEIKANLESIGIRRDQIRELSDNPELAREEKQWILEEIRRINFLREDNARKVKQLNEDVKSKGIKIKELEVMIESLVQEIQWKDEQISMLQGELATLDQQYSALFDAYQEQSIAIESLTDKLNTVYYAYGSAKELRENNIVEKKNGFIGIGKRTYLKKNFNDEYFTSIDATKTKSITIEGNNLHLISDHPTNSYTLQESGARTYIKIDDPAEFWKITKYLVVIVD